MNRLLAFAMLLLLSCSGLTHAADLREVHHLHKSLRLARAGDFLVTVQGKLYTLLHMHTVQGSRLVIEEIAIPKNYFPSNTGSWRSWVEEGAPRHTAWSLYEIDLDTGQILEFYSVTQQAWGSVAQGDSFLSTLLYLPLYKLNSRERKRVGPAPMAGQMDRRRFWHPRLVVDGEAVGGVEFEGWRTHWPRDGSELSGKMIDLYLPSDPESGVAYFPAWLEVAGAIGRAQLRIIDSGKDLKSPQNSLPRRPPQIVKLEQDNDGSLGITVQTRPYYHGFVLYASPEGSTGQTFIELSHKFSESNEDPLLNYLSVEAVELADKLTAGVRYRFFVQPNGFPEVLGETKDTWLNRARE